MMAPADPLRNTLDHLALDPKAQDDRKYLVSMLRRLGYSDAEIKVALGEMQDRSRVIEIEYRKGPSAGAGAFSVVEEPEDIVEFTLRADPVPAFEEPEEEPVGFSVAGGFEPAPVAEEDVWSYDAQEVDPEPFEAFDSAMDPAVAHGWVPLDGDSSLHPVDVDNPWIAEDAGWAAPASQAADFSGAEWVDDEDSEEGPVEFGERPLEEAAAWPTEPEAATWEDSETEDWPTEEAPAWDAAEPEAWADSEEAPAWDAAEPEAWADGEEAPAWDGQAAEYQVTEAPGGAWVPEQGDGAEQDWAPAADEIAGAEGPVDDTASFMHGDFRLYTRMVELSTGRQQRIYFFSKSEPRSGAPCELPAGYVVEENAQTGLPFLRRDPNAADAPAASPAEPSNDAWVDADEAHEHCLGITKAGAPCKKAPLEGAAYCNVHKGRA